MIFTLWALRAERNEDGIHDVLDLVSAQRRQQRVVKGFLDPFHLALLDPLRQAVVNFGVGRCHDFDGGADFQRAGAAGASERVGANDEMNMPRSVNGAEQGGSHLRGRRVH